MTMTSTVLQRPATTTTTTTTADKKATKATTATAARNRNTMAWSHEKLRFSCIDNIGLKQLWKLIALDTASSNSNSHNNSHNNSNSNVEQPKVNNNNNEVSNLAKKKATRKTKTQAAVTSMQSHPRRKQTQQQRKWPKHTPTTRAQAPLYRVAPAHDSLHSSLALSQKLYCTICFV